MHVVFTFISFKQNAVLLNLIGLNYDCFYAAAAHSRILYVLMFLQPAPFENIIIPLLFQFA